MTVYDEYNVNTGVLTKRVDLVSLTGDKFAGANAASGLTGIRSIYTAASYASLDNVAKGYKYDTTPLAQATSGENAGWANSADSKLYITANMSDTGWSNAYVPTLGEIQAFGFGYKLSHSDGRTPFYKSEVPYNPTTWANWVKQANSSFNAANNSAIIKGIEPLSYNAVTLTAGIQYGIIHEVVSKVGSAQLLASSVFNWTSFDSNIGNNKRRLNATNNGYFVFYRPGAGIDDSIEVRNVRVYVLPAGSQIEADFTNLTADELAIKYPFDGLNVKHWKKLVGTEAEIQASITSTLPTASYAGFTPYKMIYELDEPIEEQHTPVTLPTHYPTTVITTTNDTPAELETTTSVKVEDQ